ncbi:MAG: hypothetical protein ACSLFM_02145 [Tepidiformaceae bacterium]
MDNLLSRYRDSLLATPEATLPVLTAYLDLQPGAPSGEPTALTVLDQAVRAAKGSWQDQSRDAMQSLEADLEAVRASAEDAIREGVAGLGYAGCAGGDFRAEIRLPLPFRNDIRVGAAPWLLELERFGYMHGTAVVVILADLHTVELRRFSFGNVTATSEVDHDADALTRSTHGRTNVEGRSASGSSASGGHSRNDVQRVVAAHRLQFAKEAGEEIGRFVGPEDLVLLAGVSEARSQVMQVLDGGLRARVTEVARQPASQGDAALVAFAHEEAVTLAVSRADDRAGEIISGAAGDQSALGVAAVQSALTEGRLAQLILHDEATGHFGTATDARLQAGPGRDDVIEQLIRGALATSSEVLFCKTPSLLSEHEGVGGLLRW